MQASVRTCLLNSRFFAWKSPRCRRPTSLARRTVMCWSYSTFGRRLSPGVSLLVRRSLDTIVNVVFAGDGGQLLVADVAVKTFEFPIAVVYAPNIAAERCLFLRRLESFLDASKRTVRVWDWNAILDPKGRSGCLWVGKV